METILKALRFNDINCAEITFRTNCAKDAIKLAEKVRNLGFSCEMDLTNKKFVKQLEKASKTAKYALILGEDEINSNTITIKNLETSEQKNISLENIAAELN